MYLPSFDMWTLMMDRDGFDFKYMPSTAPTAGGPASAVEGSKSLQQPSKPDPSSDNDTTTKKPSGLRGLFKRRSRPSTGATSIASTVSSSSGQPLKSAVELMILHPRSNEDDVVHGIGQWDTEGDAKFPPPVPENGPMPVICLPVINTRNCGKKALREDMGFQLDGVSGLLLIPPDPNFPGFYQRVGSFHLVGDASKKLRNSAEDLENYKNLFLAYDLRSIRLA